MIHAETALSRGTSVVVPVYNSEATLPELVARLAPVLRGVGGPFELWLVNDGSRDGSWQVIGRLARENDWVRGINMMRNYGQHNATLCGIRAAGYDVTVTMDDDLQHPPEELPKLLGKLAEGHDVVYGTPHELPHSWWRNWTSALTKKAVGRALGLSSVRDISAFRALRTELRRASAGYRGSRVHCDVLFSWGTARFAGVPVRHAPRAVGRSNYNLIRLFNQTVSLLIGYSTGPLRLASLVGFLFTVFGMAVLTYVILAYLLLGSLRGFPFLASVISIFSGAQLFTLGIFGEYLAHIFNRSLDRPTYVVRQSTGEAGAAPGAHPASRSGGDAGAGGPAPVPSEGRS